MLTRCGTKLSRNATWRNIAMLLSRGVLGCLCGLVLWSVVLLPVGFHGSIITSGSMRPTINAGDVVVAKPISAGTDLLGRVVVAHDPARPTSLLTHRVVSELAGGELRTRGDANAMSDSDMITRADIVGRGFILVPWVGMPGLWWASGNVVALFVTGAGLVGLTALARDPDRLRRPRGRRPHALLAPALTLALALAATLTPGFLDRARASFTSEATNDGNAIGVCDTIDGARFALTTASASVDAASGPENAVDCSHDTAWIGRPEPTGHLLELDLGAPVTPRELRFLWVEGSQLPAFIVSGSHDGRTWETVTVAQGSGTSEDVVPIPAGSTYSHWQILAGGERPFMVRDWSFLTEDRQR